MNASQLAPALAMARYLDLQVCRLGGSSNFRGGSMKRYLYAFDSCAAAQHAFEQFRKHGLRPEDISIVPGEARAWKLFTNSLAVLIPRSGPGATTGGLAGLCVGVCALSLLRIDSDVAAFMLLLFTAGAAILGAWISTPIDTIDCAQQTPEEEGGRGRRFLVIAYDLRSQAMLSEKFAPKTRASLFWHRGGLHRSEGAGEPAVDLPRDRAFCVRQRAVRVVPTPSARHRSAVARARA